MSEWKKDSRSGRLNRYLVIKGRYSPMLMTWAPVLIRSQGVQHIQRDNENGPIQPLQPNSYAKHVQDALHEHSLIVTEHPERTPLPGRVEFHCLSHMLSITLYPRTHQ